MKVQIVRFEIFEMKEKEHKESKCRSEVLRRGDILKFEFLRIMKQEWVSVNIGKV